MLTDRNVRRDLFSLGLLVLVIFLGFALATYDPADPVVELVYPFNQLYQPDAAGLSHPLVRRRTFVVRGVPWRQA